MNDISDLKPGVVDAIDGLLQLCNAVTEHQLSIADLQAGVAMAIESGHDTAAIALFMASRAIAAENDRLALTTPAETPAAESPAQQPRGHE